MQPQAEQTYQALMRHFHDPLANRYCERAVPRPDDPRAAFLWPFSAVLSALNALADLPDGARYHGDLRRALAALEQYFDAAGRPPGYDSVLRAHGGGQKYYDDNEWLGLELLDAHAHLGDPALLDRARLVFAFVVSGWSDELGGGIYWRQGDVETKNTCSNGPAALLALRLFQATGEPAYLEWAQRILEWTRQLKDPASGVYLDHLRRDGSVDARTYTYNTGTVLHSHALLATLLGADAHLREAQALAAASLRHFAAPAGEEPGLFPDTPWFNAVLLRGYLALHALDGDATYLAAMRASLAHAWEHARDADGLFASDWSGRTGRGGPDSSLLDQGAMVELYARMARFDGAAAPEGGDRTQRPGAA
jgi:uncharacterized protein YyaL (SSP411 family)